MVWRTFACDHSTQKSSIGLHKIHLYRNVGRGRGDELEIRADNFKTIAKHKLVDKTWAPIEDQYIYISIIIRPVCDRVFCYKQPNTNKTEKLARVKIGAFNYSASLHQNDFIDKSFIQEEGKFCEVSQDTDKCFVCTIKNQCIFLVSWCSPMVLLFYFHTFL